MKKLFIRNSVDIFIIYIDTNVNMPCCNSELVIAVTQKAQERFSEPPYILHITENYVNKSCTLCAIRTKFQDPTLHDPNVAITSEVPAFNRLVFLMTEN